MGVFDVEAGAYDRFMGRFAQPLAVELGRLLGPVEGQTALDVGCGPGALTAELVRRLGPGCVHAVDPSEPFVAAARERMPEVDVQLAPAESLPFADDAFDLAAAQLVVAFMADPVAGLTEMARVTRPGGLVGACFWDVAGGRAPISTVWRAAVDLDPTVQDESGLAGGRDGHLVELLARTGLRDVRQHELSVHVPVGDFEAWWTPFGLGVGPVGAFVAGLDEAHREALRARCAELLPDGPITVDAVAWVATGHVPGAPG